MKKTIRCLAALLLAACGGAKDIPEANLVNASTSSVTTPKAVSSTPVTYANTINSGELKEMLYTYASDEFEGRETGEKGQKMAVEYIKKQYQDMGIASPLRGDDYFQEVPMEKQQVATATLIVNGTNISSFDEQIVLAASESMELSASEIIYAGYGIDSDKYSDYANLDVRGKIVLVKAGEPKDENGNYITTGTTDLSKWTNGRQALSSKRDAAKNNGAKAIVYIDSNLFPRYAGFYRQMSKNIDVH